jgi:hypothetical protein
VDDWTWTPRPNPTRSHGCWPEMETMAERMQSQADYKPPTEAELDEGRRAFESCIERMRAERGAVKDFTAAVEAKLAEGVPLGGVLSALAAERPG